MQRYLPKINENFIGYYYDIRETGIENGKTKYEFDKEPNQFTWKETDISGSAVFTGSKGFEKSSANLGGVVMTEKRLYRIQTSDSYIPFKVNGKVVIEIDGMQVSFIITKLTQLTRGQHTLFTSRLNGGITSGRFPIVIEMR